MGKGSGGGTNTVTNNSAPPADVTAQYDNIIGQANTLSGSPLNQYGGPQVAGFTPAQTAAFNTVNNSQGIQTPYLNSAQTMLQNSQTPIWNSAQQWSPNAVQQYENPYNTDVTNATMANINETNAQQNQQVVGNAISSGAWGGDRSAIAQSELARQQALASNQTLAGLNANNYNQAQTEFNQQQGAQIGANQSNNYLASQGAFGESALGTAAQNSALTGANAQLNVGNQQQTLAQSALNIPYEQFLQQQAYPYQNLSWLSGLSTGMGSGEGGTSSTTSPGANTASQIAGLGTGLSGLAGSSGLLGSSGTTLAQGFGDDAASSYVGGSGILGWLGSLGAAFKEGGAVPTRKSGGFVPRYGMGGDIPNVDVSYFPEMKPSGGAGLNSLNSTSMGGTSTSTSSSDSGGGSTMDSILKLLPIAAEVAMAMNRGGVAKRRGFIPHYASGGDTTTLTGVPGSDVPYIPANLHLTRGMGIPQAPRPYDSNKNTNDIANEAKAISSIGKSVFGSGSNSNQNPQGFDDGGAIPSNSFSTTVTGSLAPQAQSAITSMGNMTDEQLREYAARTGSSLAKQMIQKRQMMPPGQQPASQQQASAFQQPQTFADGGMTDDNAAKMVQLYSDDDSDAPVSQPTGLGPPAPPGPVAPQQQRGFVPPDSADMPHYDGAGADPINKPDPWLALAHAGFAMAAGQSPHALTNIGQGALAGVEDYQKQKEEAAKESQQQGTLKQQAENLYEQTKEKRAQMFETAQHDQTNETQNQQQLNDLAAYRAKQLEQGKVAVGIDGIPRYTSGPNAGQAVPGAATSVSKAADEYSQNIGVPLMPFTSKRDQLNSSNQIDAAGKNVGQVDNSIDSINRIKELLPQIDQGKLAQGFRYGEKALGEGTPERAAFEELQKLEGNAAINNEVSQGVSSRYLGFNMVKLGQNLFASPDMDKTAQENILNKSLKYLEMEKNANEVIQPFEGHSTGTLNRVRQDYYDKSLAAGSPIAAQDYLAGKTSSAPTATDIAYLKQTPAKAAAFDAFFGAGASSKYLNGGN